MLSTKPRTLGYVILSPHSRIFLRIPSPNPNAGKKICTRRRNKYRYPYYSISLSATEKAEQRTLQTHCSHDSVWVPARGPSRCRLFTSTDNEGQSITESSLRQHPPEEEQKSGSQASSSKTTIGELDHRKDGVPETGETTRNKAASKEDHDYAEVFQTRIAIPPDYS